MKGGAHCRLTQAGLHLVDYVIMKEVAVSDVYPCPIDKHTDGIEPVYAVYSRTSSTRFAKPQRRDLDKWRPRRVKLWWEAVLLFAGPTAGFCIYSFFKSLFTGAYWGDIVGYALFAVLFSWLVWIVIQKIRNLIRQNTADKQEYDAAVVTRAKQNENLRRQWQNELLYCHKHDIVYLPYASRGYKPEESMSALDPNRGLG